MGVGYKKLENQDEKVLHPLKNKRGAVGQRPAAGKKNLMLKCMNLFYDVHGLIPRQRQC